MPHDPNREEGQEVQSAEPKQATISDAEVDRILAESREKAQELRTTLDEAFRLPRSSATLRLK